MPIYFCCTTQVFSHLLLAYLLETIKYCMTPLWTKRSKCYISFGLNPNTRSIPKFLNSSNVWSNPLDYKNCQSESYECWSQGRVYCEPRVSHGFGASEWRIFTSPCHSSSYHCMPSKLEFLLNILTSRTSVSTCSWATMPPRTTNKVSIYPFGKISSFYWN